MKILRDDKGQSLVEFAIILPILMLLVMGIIEFGMMLNSYLAIQNASREGARYGIIGTSNGDIQNLVASTSPSLNSSYLTVDITPNDGSRKSGDTLTVKVSYEYHLTVPIISSLLGDSVTLTAQTSMRIE